MYTTTMLITHRLPPARRSQSGFTLIEMMISVTIGLGILAGLVGVLATNSGNAKTNDRTAELVTNGRYALNSIRSELREAGFRAYTWAEPSTPGALGLTGANNECLEGGAPQGAFVSNIRQGVWGSDNTNPFQANCIPQASYLPNTDVLVVRRLAVVVASPAEVASNPTRVHFQSSYERGQIFRAGAAPPFTGSPVPLASFPVQIYVYYISPFTNAANEVPLVPALRRVFLRSDGTMESELVASGIERMQVRYGRLTTVPDTQYFDSVPGTSFDLTPNGAWDEVNAVRIWLLARNTSPELGYVNNQTYQMGNQPYTVNDNFRRQLFTSVVQLRN